MRKACLVLLLGIALFLVPNLVDAQEKGTRVGVGVSMGREIIYVYWQSIVTMSDYPSFYLPLYITSRFRIEPEFGFWRYSYSEDVDRYEKSKYTVFSLGCGIFPASKMGKVQIYYGARFVYIHFSRRAEVSHNGKVVFDQSKTDFSIGPAIGGEYFFSDHLSLGGEAQLNYISIGQFVDDDEISESLISSKTLVFVRWYF